MMILFCLLLLPNIKIPLINKWGKNSLYIYLFHRLFTIVVEKELFNPLTSPCEGAPSLKYGDVNTETTSLSEVKGLIKQNIIITTFIFFCSLC